MRKGFAGNRPAVLLVKLIVICIAVGMSGCDTDPAVTLPKHVFEQLLNESSLSFSQPSEFVDVETEINPVQRYERALRHLSGELEIRYIIRPLKRISIDYNDPHNAAPEPNHLFPLLFESLTEKLSRGGDTSSRQYPPSQASDLFNADWAAASIFDVEPNFSNTYSQGLLIGIHKDDHADAYTVFLYNE